MRDLLGSFGKFACAHEGGPARGERGRSGRCSEMRLGSFGMRVVGAGWVGPRSGESELASMGVCVAIP